MFRNHKSRWPMSDDEKRKFRSDFLDARNSFVKIDNAIEHDMPIVVQTKPLFAPVIFIIWIVAKVLRWYLRKAIKLGEELERRIHEEEERKRYLRQLFIDLDNAMERLLAEIPNGPQKTLIESMYYNLDGLTEKKLTKRLEELKHYLQRNTTNV